MRFRLLAWLGCLAGSAWLGGEREARAADLEVPAQGGLPALAVTVSRADGVVRYGRPGGPTASVIVDSTARPLPQATVRAVPIGLGRSVAHVVVPLPQGAWEAILAPSLDAPVFAGRTGYSRGNEGEREGTRVDRIAQPDGTQTVLVSDIQEDASLCGDEATPLRPRGLDPKTLTLRGATYQRLSPSARAGSRHLVATVLASPAKPPVASLLTLGGESGAARLGQHLLDGRADTAWSEDRPGAGQGEFVTLRTSRELGIERVVFTLGADVVAPRTLYLVTPGEVRDLVVPEEVASRGGAELEVRFAVPLRTECVSIVLGDAYSAGVTAPRVGLAGVAAYATFEGRSLDEIVNELKGEGATEATAFLKRAGQPGLDALERAYPSLDGAARARAIEVATAAESCDAAAGVLLRGVIDVDREASRKARGRLERCGKGAAGALRAGLGAKDPKLRAAAAELLGLVAPREALAPLAAALGAADPAERSAVRAALKRAARTAEPEALARLTGSSDASPARAGARVELLRALAERLGDLPGAEALLLGALAGADMPARYVLVEPARALALAGHPEPLGALLDDKDPHVRARAAEAAMGVAGLTARLDARVADPEPRVREAALLALGAAKAAPEQAASLALAKDEWTFVRVAAAAALGAGGPRVAASASDALGRALADPATLVKQAALAALGARRATSAAGAIGRVARDAEVGLDLRVTATRALGAVCAANEVDYLTRAALRVASPADEADLRLGLAALDALGRIHPADLAARLAPLLDKKVRLPVRNAANRALTDQGTCPPSR